MTVAKLKLDPKNKLFIIHNAVKAFTELSQFARENGVRHSPEPPFLLVTWS